MYIIPLVGTKPTVGMAVTIRGLRWHCPDWEFDCPTAIISPVYRFFEDGRTLENAMESVLIDTCIDEVWKGNKPTDWDWRGWNEKYLWNKFYSRGRGVQRVKSKIIFIRDEDGELTWIEYPMYLAA